MTKRRNDVLLVRFSHFQSSPQKQFKWKNTLLEINVLWDDVVGIVHASKYYNTHEPQLQLEEKEEQQNKTV